MSRELRAQEPDDVVRLTPSLEDHSRIAEGVERRLEVRDVGQHDVLAGEVHQEAVVADQSVGRAALREPRVHVRDDEVLDRLRVVALDQKVQRAVDRRIRLPHLEAGLIRQAGVARGVHEAIGLDAGGAEAGGELDGPQPAILEHDAGHHRTDEHLNAGRFDLLLDPAGESHLVGTET